ncbi:MAG: hypothetical protein GXO16_04685, partial [Epsilonproteobacteria bacterium]|nr:hypothetical protein [Campylobacterota bacterium]
MYTNTNEPTAEKIKSFLLGPNGNDGYLFDEISKHKLIMIAGRWGTGKTYFWKGTIENDLKERGKPVVTLSLYGKESIDDIKQELFYLLYYHDKRGKDLIEKAYSVFGSLSKISRKAAAIFEEIDKRNNVQKEKKALKILDNHAIICFD